MSTPPQNKKSTGRQINFEKTLAKLEEVIARLEAGELPLEESIKQFEQGTALLKDCRKVLDEAEQKVKILSEKNRDFQLEDFEDNGKK